MHSGSDSSSTQRLVSYTFPISSQSFARANSNDDFRREQQLSIHFAFRSDNSRGNPALPPLKKKIATWQNWVVTAHVSAILRLQRFRKSLYSSIIFNFRWHGIYVAHVNNLERKKYANDFCSVQVLRLSETSRDSCPEKFLRTELKSRGLSIFLKKLKKFILIKAR